SLCEVASGDRYLLCSDGLTDVVGPRAIQEVLAAVPEPQTAVNRLIRLANRGGGPDNITCVVVDVVDGPVEQDPEPVVLGAAAEVDLDQAATDAVPPGWLPRWMRRLVHG